MITASFGGSTPAGRALRRARFASYQGQRIEGVIGGIERRNDRLGQLWVVGRLPQVDIVRQLEPRAFAADEHPHVRPVRIWRIDTLYDADLARVEPHDRADRRDADQLDEPPDQVLVEML